MPNFDEKTGIRYGVISPHSISRYALDDIYTHGTDPHWEEFKAEIRVHVGDMAGRAPFTINDDLQEKISDLIIDELSNNFESCGDGQMDYSDDEYDLHVSGDNFGIFVMRSPYYTYCRNCSPCAPGAGDLDSPTEKDPEYPVIGITLCLGKEWFDEDSPCPYRVYRVDNDQEVI